MTKQSHTSQVLRIIVGSHPSAERDDRPTASRLRAAVESALAAQKPAGGISVELMTDLWFMNDAALVAAPAIAIGTVQTSAAVAHLASRLPQALVVDGSFEILFDREAGDCRVCLRGVDGQSTSKAVDAFIEKFLGQWIESATFAPQA